ncbi:MAG: hypothetical protein QXZ25_06250 [Candidatus Bathyarchaeia archaeon]
MTLEELGCLPSADQPRVALTEIVKQLSQINATMKRLCEILEYLIQNCKSLVKDT